MVTRASPRVGAWLNGAVRAARHAGLVKWPAPGAPRRGQGVSPRPAATPIVVQVQVQVQVQVEAAAVLVQPLGVRGVARTTTALHPRRDHADAVDRAVAAVEVVQASHRVENLPLPARRGGVVLRTMVALGNHHAMARQSHVRKSRSGRGGVWKQTKACTLILERMFVAPRLPLPSLALVLFPRLAVLMVLLG